MERAFRSLKTIDPKVRPIHHRLAELVTIVRNTCCTPAAGADAPTFNVITTASPQQKRALDLLQQIRS